MHAFGHPSPARAQISAQGKVSRVLFSPAVCLLSLGMKQIRCGTTIGPRRALRRFVSETAAYTDWGGLKLALLASERALEEVDAKVG